MPPQETVMATEDTVVDVERQFDAPTNRPATVSEVEDSSAVMIEGSNLPL